MKIRSIANRKMLPLLYPLGAYLWLVNLMPLAAGDTYYSVYLLCALVGMLCLISWQPAALHKGEACCILAAASLFSGAVVLANYDLFSPFSALENMFHLVCTLFGGVWVGGAILLWMYQKLPASGKTDGRRHSIRVFFLSFCSIAAIQLGYLLFVRYPGVLTTDSETTISQLMGQQPYDNTMPFWHTVTVKVFVDLGIALLGDINAGVAMFHGAQILFLSACFGFALMTLYQRGVPGLVLMGMYGLYALLPYNIAYSVTLWKDIPFAGAVLPFTPALYRGFAGLGRKRVTGIILVLGGLGMCLWRTNGWYAFAVTLAVLTLLLGKKQKKLLLILLAVLLFTWVLLNPVLDVLGVKEGNLVEAFAVPFQQIARVVANQRPMTQEQQVLLGQIFDLEKMARLYDPLTVDPVKFETFRYDQVDYIRQHLGQYLKVYIQLGLQYPGDYLKAWVEETKGYWNAGYRFWIYTSGVAGDSFGITAAYGEGLFASLYAAWFRYFEKLDIFQPLVSIGLHVWGLIACVLVNFLKKRQEAFLGIPVLVLVIGLWLGTPVYAEFRYAYPLFLTMPLIGCATAFAPKKNKVSPLP